MRSIISILFAVSFSNLMAQSITNNPLSYFGIGEQSFGSNAIYDALGRNNINYFDSSQLNIFNPASYSSLSTGNTLLSIGINGRGSKFTEQSNQALRITAMPDHFSLGFKVSKIAGIAFGLKPFSTRGFEIKESDSVNLLVNTYIGSGGTQSFFLGSAIRILKLDKSKLSIGFNADYIFGSVTNSRKSQTFSSSSSSYPAGIFNSTIKVIAFNVDLGISFDQRLFKNHSINLSGVYTPNIILQNSSTSEGLFYAKLITSGISYDTISYINKKSFIKTSSYKFGFAYTLNLPYWKKDTRLLHPSLILLGSYSNLRSSIDYAENLMNQISFGIQFIPESKIIQNSTNLKFYEKIYYRIGFFQQDNIISSVSKMNYKDKGITFGFGFPILVQQSLSSLNIGFTFGNKSSKNSYSLAENYFGINFGIIFSPSNFDRWFRKRKLD